MLRCPGSERQLFSAMRSAAIETSALESCPPALFTSSFRAAATAVILFKLLEEAANLVNREFLIAPVVGGFPMELGVPTYSDERPPEIRRLARRCSGADSSGVGPGTGREPRLRCVRPAVSPTNGQMGFLRSSRSRIHLHLKVHSRVRPADLRVGGPDGLAAFSWPLQLRCLGGRVAAQGKSFPTELGVPTYSERTTPEIRGLACQRVEQASGMRSRLEGASSAMLPSPWQKLGLPGCRQRENRTVSAISTT